ncbi:hypothetical protein HYY74_00020 [Candidatus Woesearchaeota archaeon]|nr:hypothetical protein [Candidatus Woesearchaeota archaeon]
MKFSYQLFRNAYYPVIPLTLAHGEKRVNTSALVDSGATISIFNSSTGSELGVDVESGEKRIFQGVSAKLIGYVHTVTVLIEGEKIQCKVAFSGELGTSFNLIGREGIFDKFSITFNESRRELLMENI